MWPVKEHIAHERIVDFLERAFVVPHQEERLGIWSGRSAQAFTQQRRGEVELGARGHEEHSQPFLLRVP